MKFLFTVLAIALFTVKNSQSKAKPEFYLVGTAALLSILDYIYTEPRFNHDDGPLHPEECDEEEKKIEKNKNQTNDCMEMDIDYFGNDILLPDEANSAGSWQECSKLCRNKYAGCKFWTFQAGKCFVKLSKDGKRNQQGAISGSCECGSNAGESGLCTGTARSRRFCCCHIHNSQHGKDKKSDYGDSCKNFNPEADPKTSFCTQRKDLYSGIYSNEKCCNSRDGSRCQEKQGDCDTKSDCDGSLVCGKNNCQEYHPQAYKNADCCIKPTGPRCSDGEKPAFCTCASGELMANICGRPEYSKSMEESNSQFFYFKTYTCKDGTTCSGIRCCIRKNKPTHFTCGDGSNFTKTDTFFKCSDGSKPVNCNCTDGEVINPSKGPNCSDGKKPASCTCASGELMAIKCGKEHPTSYTCKDGTTCSGKRCCQRKNKPTHFTCGDSSNFTKTATFFKCSDGSKPVNCNCTDGEIINPPKALCTGTSSDWGCCSFKFPCQEKEGDCNKDSHCAGSLICGIDNCQDFNPLAETEADCCTKLAANTTSHAPTTIPAPTTTTAPATTLSPMTTPAPTTTPAPITVAAPTTMPAPKTTSGPIIPEPSNKV